MTNNFAVSITKISNLTEQGTEAKGFEGIMEASQYYAKLANNNKDSVIIFWQKQGDKAVELRKSVPSNSNIVKNLFIGKINSFFK